MSQEKIREILDNFWGEQITVDTALTEINKIVMECLPKKAIDLFSKSDSAYLIGRKKGFNKAIAEFKANWEGK